MNSWYHVAATRGDGIARLYVNGELDNSTGYDFIPTDHGHDLKIGRTHTDFQYFDGIIDEVSIFNRVISPEEVAQHYNRTPPHSGAHWNFDEGEGNIIRDSSGNGNYGTIHNMNENDWVEGVSGKALDFDGVNDYISINNDVWSEEITLEAWIKPRDFGRESAAQRGRLIIFKAPNTGYCQDYSLAVATDGNHSWVGLMFGEKEGKFVGLCSKTKLLRNSWYHVAATRGDGIARLYINGILDNQKSYDFIPTNHNYDLKIGRSHAGFQYFDGIIDEVSIYNRSLSSKEIADNYEKNSPGITFGPIVSNISETSATISWVTNQASNSIVEYGDLWEYDRIIRKSDNKEKHNITIDGLLASTTYHFRVGSTILQTNDTIYSEDHSFTTLSQKAPVILWGPVVVIINNSQVNITWRTDVAANTIIEYGTKINYEKKIILSDYVHEHRAVINDLIPDTTYHYRIGSTDADGNGPTYSGDENFKMPVNSMKLTISGIKISSLNETSTSITWTTEEPTDTIFEYENMTSTPMNVIDSEPVIEHNVTVHNLSPDTEYHFKIGFSDPEDNSLSYGAKGTFSTQNVDESTSTDLNVPVTENKNTRTIWTVILISIIIIIIILITLLIILNKRSERNEPSIEDSFGRIKP